MNGSRIPDLEHTITRLTVDQSRSRCTGRAVQHEVTLRNVGEVMCRLRLHQIREAVECVMTTRHYHQSARGQILIEHAEQSLHAFLAGFVERILIDVKPRRFRDPIHVKATLLCDASDGRSEHTTSVHTRNEILLLPHRLKDRSHCR
jgi:hypothetical protein